MLTLALVLSLAAAPSPQVLSRPDGRIDLAQGVLSAPVPGDLREAALQFALSRKAELGLGPGSTLVIGDAFSTKLGATVHLEQRIAGVAVYGATAIVTFDTERRVVRVSSSLSPAPATGLVWNLSGPDALRTAAAQVNFAQLQPDRTPYGGWQPYIFPVEGKLRAGYLTWVPTLDIKENWHLAIDAADGHVIFEENRVHHATDAKVYASSPLGLSGGVGITPLIDVQLGDFPATWDGGTLEGAHIRSLNCCPTAGCSSEMGAVPRRATGMVQTFGGQVLNYDVAICDRQHRANNDPAVNPNENFVYTPVDPPTSPRPTLASLADWDEFAEVHAYYHVNKVYDYLSALSTGPFATQKGLLPFKLRDERFGRVTAVWVNASDPDFQAGTQSGSMLTSNVLTRTDNAMYVQREQMAAMAVPEYAFDSDALIMYQGDRADYAYDGPVVWHEFGHGAIHATADWNYTIALDARSANAESQALHEANADVIAAMTGNLSNVGAYVGPRATPGSSGIRDLNNSAKCPDVLWGESHQDSLHYTGAIWQARQNLFQGTDEGKTFDAAFYAALVSFPKDVDFEKAATIIAGSVAQAFPSIPDAQQQMKAIFDSRGVTNCSKVLDLTNDRTPRPYYAIPGSFSAGLAMGSLVPGPFQFKFKAPAGVKAVTLTGQSFGGGGGGTTRVRLVAKKNAPITFTRTASALTHDADAELVPTSTQGTLSGRLEITVPCGEEVYFTMVNPSSRDRVVYNLAFDYEPADRCEEPMMPVPDAGMPVEPEPVVLPSQSIELGEPHSGCGCGAGAGPLLLLALGALLRRRRS